MAYIIGFGFGFCSLVRVISGYVLKKFSWKSFMLIETIIEILSSNFLIQFSRIKIIICSNHYNNLHIKRNFFSNCLGNSRPNLPRRQMFFFCNHNGKQSLIGSCHALHKYFNSSYHNIVTRPLFIS